MRVSDVHRHQGRWEGRNFLVISAELRWTSQKAGKKLAILTKGRNASCHLRAGRTRRNLRGYLIPASRAKNVCSENILLYFNFLRLLFVYSSNYILRQEIDIEPTNADPLQPEQPVQWLPKISNISSGTKSRLRRELKRKKTYCKTQLNRMKYFLGEILNLATSPRNKHHKRGDWWQNWTSF